MKTVTRTATLTGGVRIYKPVILSKPFSRGNIFPTIVVATPNILLSKLRGNSGKNGDNSQSKLLFSDLTIWTSSFAAHTLNSNAWGKMFI